MSWLELTLRVSPDTAESAAAVLAACGSLGTWEREPGVVAAYFPEVTTPDAVRRIGAAAIAELATGGEIVGVLRIPAQDWTAVWRASVRPLQITPRLVIVPSWLKPPHREGEAVVVLDPGMAFGTGHHETTRGCLRMLDAGLARRPGAIVLDLGTGSGILAIAAARLGAASVYAMDIDPDACAVASANVRLNGVESVVTVGPSGDRRSGAPYDLIVANLTAEVIISLVDVLVGSLGPGGELILGGILIEREPPVAAALEDADLQLVQRETDGEWVTYRAASTPTASRG